MEFGELRTQIPLVLGEISVVFLETLSNMIILQVMLFKGQEVDYSVLIIQETFIKTIKYLILRLTILLRPMMEQTQRPQLLLILHPQVLQAFQEDYPQAYL